MLDVLGIRKPIGRIVGEASPSEFLFVADKENHPPKHEYISVESRELVDGELRNVEVLAQVVGVVSRSSAYSTELDLDALERIYRAGIEDVNVLCTARPLGYLVESSGRVEILMPRRAIYPGNMVFIASDDLVRRYFSYSGDEGLHIGYLVSRPSIPAHISVNGFRRHLAIIAQTGAGKSYAAGVLIEELLRKGATVIVVDPHADYVFLSRAQDNTRYKLAGRVTVFRNPASTGRYRVEDVEALEEYTVKFSDLSEDEVSAIVEVPERFTRIRDSIRSTLVELRGRAEGYSVSDFISRLEEMGGEATAAVRYARRLLKLKVFGDRTTSIDSLLKPYHVAVIDLSGLNDVSMDYIASRILREAYEKLSNGEFKYPVFIFIEEAHRFIPRSGGSYSKEIVNTIAAEGRKFGLFLVLITQRPCRIDSESLSQCNSQIILRITNPEDQKAIRSSSERLSEELLRDLPGLNTGEAIIVGEVTRVPVMVKVRRRETREGGADIDVVKMLGDARREVEMELRMVEEGRNIITPRDTMLSEV